MLQGSSDRRDHIHCSVASKIQGAGWHAFWAPLQKTGKMLHVRVVAERTLQGNGDPTEEDTQKLAAVFEMKC